MEQLDYLLGYAGVFLWAFGICQVKATRDKKRWLLSGILCAEVVLIAYLRPEDELLYWIRLLLIFLTFVLFIEERWKRKVVLFLFSVGFIDIVATPYPDSDGYHRVHKKRRSESYVWNCF